MTHLVPDLKRTLIMDPPAPSSAEAPQPRSSATTKRLLQHLSRPAWLYPWKGIYYFATHRFLWPLLRSRLLPCFLISCLVYANLFVWLYLPLVGILAFWHGPLAWFNAVMLLLGVGAVLIALLFEAFFVDASQVAIFDSVLVEEGQGALVAEGRALLPREGADPVAQLGKPHGSTVYAPFSLRQILEFILFLPFNLVPAVGPVIFLLLTSYRAGPFHHWRYFRLQGLDKKQRAEQIQRRQLRYTWFGTSALVLQLVPGLSMFFLLSTAAGSALWVVELEKRKRVARDAAAQQERQQGHPEYADDPV